MAHTFTKTGSGALLAFALTAACSGGDDTGNAEETESGGSFGYAGFSGFGTGGAVSASGAGGSGGSFGPTGTGGVIGGAGALGSGALGGNGGTSGGGGVITTGGIPGGGGALVSGGTSGSGGAGTGGVGGMGGAGTGGGSGAGTGGVAGTGGAGTGGGVGTGTCCSSGDCLCHGPDPTQLTSSNGTFKTATFTIAAGTVHYPTDAAPPFAAISICPGFTNTGPEMAPWGPFYASHGIVIVITSTGGADPPATRATKLLDAITQLKAENTKSGSPLFGKLSGRYGTSGYSMGGGGTTIASGQDPTLKTSIGLAPWGGDGANVKVPTLLLCGASDTTAPCSMSQTVYGAIAAPTPKMMMSIPAATHFSWFGPTNAGNGMSGETALAFQKVYLEGDERWKPLLLKGRGTVTTNIH
jgi:hypothetical protein